MFFWNLFALLSCETYLIDLFSFFRILNFKYLEFKGNNDEDNEETEDTDSSKEKKPWRKPKTLKNLEIRKTAEKKLKEGLDWMQIFRSAFLLCNTLSLM